MAVSVCPMDVVAAPLEEVWAILMDSARYGEWSDLAHPTITPPGPTTPGQVIESAEALGLVRARLVVGEVNAGDHRVGFNVDLMPMGIHNAASITLTALDAQSTRIAYG